MIENVKQFKKTEEESGKKSKMWKLLVEIKGTTIAKAETNASIELQG